MEGTRLMDRELERFPNARMIFSLTGCLLLGALAPLAVSAQPAAAKPVSSDPTASSAEIIIVVGAGGAPQYAEDFAAWVDQWTEVAKKSDAVATVIGRSSESVSTDRDQLEKAIKSVAVDGPTPVWIVLIGHGTFRDNVAKFNLRGADVSAAELAAWLKPVQRTVVVVNCSSASGPFVNQLSGPHRVVVTATQSGSEQNFARFGRFFADAISSADADLDHDGEVSVQEAFLQASAAVRQFYESEARISTEHALIDDNGDGRGTPAKMFRGMRAIASAKDGTELDGSKASRVTLSPAQDRLPFTPDELQERSAIEQQLDTRRSTKDAVNESEYEASLEPLLIRLAKIYQAAERRATERRAAEREAAEREAAEE